MASLDARATVVETDRGRVQVAVEGDGPPVLAIHGGPGGFDQGLAYCAHLRDGGCRLLAVSRPGYLRTPLDSGRGPEHQADLYAALLDALQIDRAAILGFSSGAPSAVHFAARHRDRTTALFVDAGILLPFEPPIGPVRRATYESAPVVRLSYRFAMKQPALATSFMVSGVSIGLNRQERRAAADWITSDPGRLRSIQALWSSTAPGKYRRPGWANDKANEVALPPLPFTEVTVPTIIAHGDSDAIVPVEHSTLAANTIGTADLIVVEQGHHLLSACRHYRPVAERQLELARGHRW